MRKINKREERFIIAFKALLEEHELTLVDNSDFPYGSDRPYLEVIGHEYTVWISMDEIPKLMNQIGG